MVSLDSRVGELVQDVAELRGLLEAANRPKVRDLLTINLRKLETELTGLKEQQAREASSRVDGKAESKPAVPLNTSKRILKQLKDYSWDQSDKFVKVYLTNLKGDSYNSKYRYLTPITWHQSPGTNHLAPTTWHLSQVWLPTATTKSRWTSPSNPCQ